MNAPTAIRQAAVLGEKTMSEIITPVALNERFTLYLNADGSPVQRSLREMTAGEVAAAVRWSIGEATRLEQEAEPARVLAVALEEGRRDVLAGMTREMMEAASATLDAFQAATERHIRLLRLLQAAMPQWRQHSQQGLSNALRRYWTHGRAP